MALPTEWSFWVRQHEMVQSTYEVSGSSFSVNTSWPGSDVVTALVSPSGVRYTRDDPNGAEHWAGPTWEHFTVSDPEPGQWTVESYGADVAAAGEPVHLTVVDETPVNQPPTAVVATGHVGDTFTFDATGSADADGSIVDYQWEFADGTYAQGPVVTHTFTPGTYDVTLVTTDDQGAKGFGYSEQIIHVGSVLTGQTVYSGSDLQITNDVGFLGAGANVVVDGDLECNTHGHVGGDVTVAGDVHLTNSCRVDGSLHAGGTVTMDSTATIGGDLVAGGDVTLQSTNAIGGAITASGTVSVIDGVPVGDLVDAGTIGGPVTWGAQVSPPDLGPAPVVGAKSLDVDQEATWAQWLHDTATAAAAPAWVAGLSTNPGCTMATWTVGTDTVEVTTDTRIDATSQTAGCGSISLHALTLELSGDLTIIADGVASTNGMHVVSADGLPHTLRLLVPGQIDDGTSGHAIALLGGTTTDETITVEIGTPGTVQLSGGANMVGQIAAGHINADGHVELAARGD